MAFYFLIPIFVIALYFAPALEAYRAKKTNAKAIFWLNLLLGWTLIGWVVALVWSLTKDTNAPQINKVSEEKKADKRPFYKKTWFLVVAGFVLLIAITNVAGSFFVTPSSTSNPVQVLTPAQKEAQAKADAEWKVSKAGQICQKHTDWARNDCEKLADNKIWIGETIDMVKYLRGEPNTANPSNYGSGTEWQWCWDDYTPSCFYGGSDGIVTSYN